MAKTKRKIALNLDKLVLLDRKGPFKSKLSLRGQYWQFHWYNVATGEIYSTHVDTDMDNFEAWEELCSSRDPWGVYEGLGLANSRKQYDLPVVSADGEPHRWMKLSRDQSFEVVELDQEERSRPNNFGLLFQ